MSKEEMFYDLCKIMANTEDIINTFENIRFIVEPNMNEKDNVSNYLYNSCDVAYHIASSLLEFSDSEEENNVHNALICATNENVEEVSKEVWDKYGIK